MKLHDKNINIILDGGIYILSTFLSSIKQFIFFTTNLITLLSHRTDKSRLGHALQGFLEYQIGLTDSVYWPIDNQLNLDLNLDDQTWSD